MHTEEFVLIPRQMYTKEQHHICEILAYKNIREKAQQISLLQETSLHQHPIPHNTTHSSKQIIQIALKMSLQMRQMKITLYLKLLSKC